MESHGTPPPYTHSSSLSTSFSSFCNISVHSIKTQGCYFFLYDATSSETPVLKLTLTAMCISDSSRVIQPIPAVTKNLLKLLLGNRYPAVPKEEQQNECGNLKSPCAEPPPCWVRREGWGKEKLLTCNQPRVQQTQPCTLNPGSWEGFGPDGFEPQEQQEHRKQLCEGALFTEPLKCWRIFIS